MRLITLFVLALAVAAATSRPAAAAFNLPWCAQYYDRSSIRSCAFYTYQQCKATISGIGGVCFENPWSPPPPALYYGQQRAKHRHAHPG